MVCNLVYSLSPLRVPPHPLGDTVHEPDLRLGFDNRQVDCFGYAGDEADYVSTRFGWSISIPLSRKRRKQCRECRECSPIRKVPTEIPVDSFQKGLHSLHRLHQ